MQNRGILKRFLLKMIAHNFKDSIYNLVQKWRFVLSIFPLIFPFIYTYNPNYFGPKFVLLLSTYKGKEITFILIHIPILESRISLKT